MISDWPHSVNRPNRRRPRCRVAAAAPPCDDAMQRAAHPSSPPHLPYMFRPTLMADGAAAPRGWLAARQRAWADTHPIYIGDTHFLGYDCLNEKRDIASAYGYSDFGSMILDNVEDLSFLLDRLPITARNLRLDVASRMFILVWALSFKIIPPSILVGRSIHDLKLMVASKDPFRKCAKVALAALHTTHGYSNFADHKKFQLCFLGFLVMMAVERDGRLFLVERVIQVRNAHSSGSHLAENLLTGCVAGGAAEIQRRRALAAPALLDYCVNRAWPDAAVERLDFVALERVRCRDFNELDLMISLSKAHDLTYQLSGIDLRDGFDSNVAALPPDDLVLQRLISKQDNADNIPTLGGETVSFVHRPARQWKLQPSMVSVFRALKCRCDAQWYQASIVRRVSAWTVHVHFTGWSSNRDVAEIDLSSPDLTDDFDTELIATPSSGPRSLEVKYNEKHYPHLLSKGTGIASAFISDGAVSKVRQNLAQRWTLKGDTSSLEIITVKERCTGYSHYGLTVEPHEANLQPLVTINLRTQPQAEAFAKQVDVQPFMSE